MRTISREDFFLIYMDYLDLMYGTHSMGDIMVTSSRILTGCLTPRAQDAELEKWMYTEEHSGRITVSPDGLSIDITPDGRVLYSGKSAAFRDIAGGT